MKKLILTITVSLLILSCNERGEITDQPSDFIIIHGKTYKLMRVVPKEGCNSIWIMYPKDSLDAMPQSINYIRSNGKTSTSETIIKVD
jgi:hypothetical protein